MPGVYYNFSCRSNDTSKKLYKFDRNMKKEVLKVSLLQAPNSKTRKNILKRIEEAATKRAPYIKGSKYAPDV